MGFLPCSQSKYISAGPSLNWNHFSHQFAKATTQYPINKSLAKKTSKINDKRSSWEYQTFKIVVLFSRLITSINRILYAPRFLTQIVFFASLLTKAYTSILMENGPPPVWFPFMLSISLCILPCPCRPWKVLEGVVSCTWGKIEATIRFSSSYMEVVLSK